jgi:hypothetical protein
MSKRVGKCTPNSVSITEGAFPTIAAFTAVYTTITLFSWDGVFSREKKCAF